MCVGVIDQKIHKLGVDTIITFKDSFKTSYDLIDFVSKDKFDKIKVNNIKTNLLDNKELDTKDIVSLKKIISYLTLNYTDNLLTLKNTYFIKDTCYKMNIEFDLLLNTIILFLSKYNITLTISKQ